MWSVVVPDPAILASFYSEREILRVLQCLGSNQGTRQKLRTIPVPPLPPRHCGTSSPKTLRMEVYLCFSTGAASVSWVCRPSEA